MESYYEKQNVSRAILKRTLELIYEYEKHHENNKEEFENKLLGIIDKHPEILTVMVDGNNLGMVCADYKFENVVLRCLDDKEASLQTDWDGENIGMYAANNHLHKAVLKALENKEAAKQYDDNRGRTIAIMASVYAGKNDAPLLLKILDMPEICLQQDAFGRNIAMYAAMNKIENVVLKALDNPELATQQDMDGMNVGMFSAQRGLTAATIKSLRNKTAREQKNRKGQTIEDIAKENEVVLEF